MKSSVFSLQSSVFSLQSSILILSMGWLSSIAVAQSPNNNSNNNKWSTTGNVADSTTFIGTTNTQKLVFKCNSITGLEINPDAETHFMGDVFIEPFIPPTYLPPEEIRVVTADNDGKLTLLNRQGLVSALYDEQLQCITDLNGNFVPAWSAKGLTPTLGALFTGVNCPAWVGIGTDSPTASLDVRGKGFFASDLQIVANASKMVIGAASSEDLGHGTSYLGFNAQRFGSTNGIWQTTSDGAHNGGAVIYGDIFGSLRFVTLPNTGTTDQTIIPDSTVAQNTRLFIHNNGNVGIGTNNPTEKLQIGNGNVLIKGVSGFLTTGDEAIVYLGDNNNFIRSVYGSGVQIGVFGAPEALHIANNGNVGIGTTAVNGAKLSVEGFVRAREVIVNLSTWSDFVFETTYTLRTLPQVEQYILANKHLPDVPSEKEVLENGVSLGEMNALLLQKVEELTLYMIEMNKQLELLKAEKK